MESQDLDMIRIVGIYENDDKGTWMKYLRKWCQIPPSIMAPGNPQITSNSLAN